MKLTNEDVQEILQLLDASKFDELHLQTDRFQLTLRRNTQSGDWSQEMQVLSTPNLIQSAPLVPAQSASATAKEVAGRPPSDWIDVRAHLPGTFYRAPKPGAPPFVEVGAHVENDTVVGIIETMKLMNAVHAEARGEIAEICCANAQFAEKGAVLLRIKPSST